MKIRVNGSVLLAGASLAFTYLVAEFVLFRLLLPAIPLKLHLYLPEGIRILAQSSKDWAEPSHYIAIVGDSYAQGEGDWLRSANPNFNRPFHSAHVIHERTGRDVVTFGRGGAGSLKGMVTFPINTFRYVNASLLYELEPPEVLLIYFYEGNDLNENPIRVYVEFTNGNYDTERVLDPEYFRGFIDQAMVRNGELSLEAERFSLLDNLFFARFLGALLSGEARRLLGREPPAGVEDSFQGGYQRNQFVVNGRIVDAPPGLQGPALGLTEEQTRDALYVFEQSLRYLSDHFSDSDACVVYIPSPLATYEIATRDVSIQRFFDVDLVPADTIEPRSREIRAAVEKIAADAGVAFVDAGKSIRLQARSRLLHGPRDWRHFNRAGYTALGEAALACLRE